MEGDGLKLTETQAVTFSHATDAQVLVFDLRAKESAPSRKQSFGGLQDAGMCPAPLGAICLPFLPRPCRCGRVMIQSGRFKTTIELPCFFPCPAADSFISRWNFGHSR